MPSWKKIVQSGSTAELSQITASDGIKSTKINVNELSASEKVNALQITASDGILSNNGYFHQNVPPSASTTGEAKLFIGNTNTSESFDKTAGIYFQHADQAGNMLEAGKIVSKKNNSYSNVAGYFQQSQLELYSTIGFGSAGPDILRVLIGGTSNQVGGAKMSIGTTELNPSMPGLTVQGDISASGVVYASAFSNSTGSDISVNDITASGDIWASGSGAGIVLGGVRRTTWPSGGGGGGTGIFNPTGSKMATTNAVEITGSLKVSGSSTFTNIGAFKQTGDTTISGSNITLVPKTGEVFRFKAGDFVEIKKPVSGVREVQISGSLKVSGSSTLTNIGTFRQTGNTTMSGSVILVPKQGEVFTFKAGDFVEIKKPISGGVKEVVVSGSLRVSGSNSFKVEGPTQLTGSFAITKPDDSGNDLIIDDTGFIYSGSKMRVTGSVEGTGNMSVGGTLSSTGDLTIGNNKLTINSTTGTLTSQAAIIAHTSSYISAGQIKGDRFIPR